LLKTKARLQLPARRAVKNRPSIREDDTLNTIPKLTIILWLLLVAAYKIFPQLLFNQNVQFPLAVLLSILLPVCFWIKAVRGEKFSSLIFIGIFFFNSALLLYALERNYSAEKAFTNSAEKGIDPQIAEMLTRAEPIQRRQFAAQIIYQRYGVALPYKSSNVSYSLYVAEQTDKDKYRNNFARTAQVDMARINATKQMLTAFLLLALHVGIFTILLIFLILYELEPQKEKKRRLRINMR
jgi:hypothetical protein